MNLAYQAQGDIGLDYSWLADVTYEDWQVSISQRSMTSRSTLKFWLFFLAVPQVS